jgi:hypothetical protein
MISTMERGGMRLVGFYLLGGAALSAALFVWQGNSYWSYSEGVYAETARSLLHGGDLYGQVAAAQPPPLFFAGAAVLALSDSIWSLRAVLGVVTLIEGGLVAISVWRLTQNQVGSLVAGLAALLTPWSLHEHGHLEPETFSAPLLLGAALLAAKPRTSSIAGALAAMAALFKLAYILPAGCLLVVATNRRSYVGTAVAVFATLGAFFFALFGQSLFGDVVTAQLQTGTRRLHDIFGFYAQGAWNIFPFVLLAVLAFAYRARCHDEPLLRTLIALFASSLILLGSVAKLGSDLNVLAVVEAPGVALAAAGLILLFTGGPVRVPLHRAVRAVAVFCAILVVVQSASLVLSPSDPRIFIRPFSRLAHERKLSSEQVDQQADRARRCPRGEAYSGDPYVAFIARRPMPGNQPDPFIVANAGIHATLRRAADAAPRCP